MFDSATHLDVMDAFLSRLFRKPKNRHNAATGSSKERSDDDTTVRSHVALQALQTISGNKNSTLTNYLAPQVTYVFPIFIQAAASDEHEQNTPAVALYNAALPRNYISGPFAEKLGYKSGSRRTICLVWACKALGRYRQRTVFCVAPDARFDILFGPEDNDNVQQPQLDLFQNGIKSGELKTEFASGKISFQKGIEEGIMQRVAQSSASNNQLVETEVGFQIWTLAELENQVDTDPQKELEYKQQQDLNYGRADFPFKSQADESGSEMPSRTSSPIPVPRRHASLGDDESLKAGSLGKAGSKRSHSERNDEESESVDADFVLSARSPKLRSLRALSVEPALPSVAPPVLGGLEPHRIHRKKSSRNNRRISQQSFEVIYNTAPQLDACVPNRLGEPVILDRRPSLNSAPSLQPLVEDDGRGKVLDDENNALPQGNIPSSNLYISPPASCSGEDLAVPLPENDAADQAASSKRQQARSDLKKRNRKSKGDLSIDWAAHVSHLTTQDGSEYWAWDTETRRYFHLDTVTGKKSWYLPPP